MATCPSSSAVSGNGGRACVDDKLIARLTGWTVNEVSSVSEWGDSDNGSFQNTKPARRSATGNMTGRLDRDDQVYDKFRVGSAVELQLWEDGDAGSPAVYWYFACVVITSFDLTFDVDTKEVVAWTANWTADGMYNAPGETNIAGASPTLCSAA